MLFKIDIILNELYYKDLPQVTFKERLKKSRLLTGLTQEELAMKTNLSRSTIDDLESGKRKVLKKSTLMSLLTVLDKSILCDDYHLFILNQHEYLKTKYNKLLLSLNIHRTTKERLLKEEITISRKLYEYLLNKEDL